MKLIIDSDVIPYVRMTRRGKFVDPRAQVYLNNQTVLKALIHNAIHEQLTPEERQQRFKRINQTPLKITLNFEVAKLHTGDLDNLVKAVIDAGQHILYNNDCWIDSITASRVKADVPRIVMTIEELRHEKKKYRHKKELHQA